LTILVRLLGVLLALALAACTAAHEDRERMARFIEELAFGNPASPEGTSARLIRWSGPVRLVFESEVPEERQRTVVRRFQRVAALAGVTVSDAVDAAPLSVQFTAERDIAVRDLLAPCAANWNASPRGIQRARIVISIDRAETMARCLDHELMHAFGFAHHSGIEPSVMSPFRQGGELTAADELALRALYDARLRPGMTRAEVGALLPAILADPAGRTP
jgi:hypothetical protein